MTGEFSADSTFLKSTPFNPLKSTVMYRPAGAVGGGGTLGVTAKRESTVDRSAESELKSMPVYGTPPSILFINMALAPGESKTYKYEIMLPKTLPPSHKGKIIRFSYKLIVGIQRGGTSHKSQVIQLPFRVFSFVQDDGSRPTYELMSPAVFTKDESTIAEETNFSSVHAGFPDEFVTGKKKSRDDYSASLYDREELIDCVARTIARCQMSRKVSYDICKNADHVAQLILQKNVYRLGETVMGVLHFSNSTIPCFRMSAFLESQEVVEEEYAVRSAEESTSLVRRIYAEQHRYTLGTRRIGIELFIPPTSSPNFNTSAVSVRWSLRVEFITGKEKQLHLQAANNLAFVHKHAIPTAKVEAFDCVIPLQIYGCKDGKSSQTQSYEIL
ncbi:Rgp1-domain-containing protein [Powellomyces hirtus]|nr:Rgp1-domain-containing protein [Powellomyces hirtus]